MKAEVISVGTELLLGDITDTNATYIAQKLTEIGLDLLYRTTVGDNEQRIAEVVDHALNRVDVVIVTGGLGPTVDDVTREGISRATGRPLEFRQELLDQIAERFRRFQVTMSENNRRQAYVPQGANPIENPVGTAPIFILETERGVVMVLPGVPREMKHLLDNDLLPWLRNYLGAPAVIKSRVLRTAGIGESQIDTQIADLMTMSNPTVGLAAHAGQVDIRITAKASSEEEAQAMISPVEEDIRQRIGKWIYGTGTETVENAVLELLSERKASVTTLEIGTQGMLKERLSAASTAFLGLIAESYTLDNLEELRRHGVEPVGTLADMAQAAAQAIREEQRATYGVVVLMQNAASAGDPKASGAGIAVVSAESSRSRTYEWTNIRTDAPIWVTTQALAMLRRALLIIQE